MKVYLNNDRVQHGEHNVFVAPAAHLPATECPREWFERDGETPKQIQVTFVNGELETTDAMGKYLVAQNHAKRTRLQLPRFAA